MCGCLRVSVSRIEQRKYMVRPSGDILNINKIPEITGAHTSFVNSAFELEEKKMFTTKYK